MKTPESDMRQVLALAAEAMEQGEFPITSIVILDDEIIAPCLFLLTRCPCYSRHW